MNIREFLEIVQIFMIVACMANGGFVCGILECGRTFGISAAALSPVLDPQLRQFAYYVCACLATAVASIYWHIRKQNQQ